LTCGQHADTEVFEEEDEEEGERRQALTNQQKTLMS